MDPLYRSLLAKHGRDFFTGARGTGIVDVEELRHLYKLFVALRNDPIADAEDAKIAWKHIWLRDFHWQYRDNKDRSQIKYFIYRDSDPWEVIATGPDVSHFRSVAFYPSWATDFNLEFAIERATSDAEVHAAIATYHDDKARLAKLLQ